MITADNTKNKLWTTSKSPSGMILGNETEKERKKRIKEYEAKKLLENEVNLKEQVNNEN